MAEFRPRSNPELVDITLQLYRRHFTTYFTLGLITALPVSLPVLFGKGNTVGAATSGMIILSTFVLGIAALVGYAALTIVTSDFYLGRTANIGIALQIGLKRFGQLFVATFIAAFAIIIGLVCLIIPGLFMLRRYVEIAPVLLLEQLSAAQALKRSEELTKDYTAKILLLTILSLLGLLVISSIVTAVFFALEGHAILMFLLSLISGAFLRPILPILIVALYYDLRIRKEGYDLELMAAATPSPSLTPVGA